MIRGLTKVILFYTAYTPLLLVLLVKNLKVRLIPAKTLNPGVNMTLSVAIICLIILALAFLLIKRLVKRISEVAGHKSNIEILENLNSENLTFLLTYIIPVIIDVKGIRDLVSLAILLMIILFVYMSSDLLMYNIFFNFFGYNIYKIKFNKSDKYLIFKGRLSKGERSIKLDIFCGDIFVGEEGEQ